MVNQTSIVSEWGRRSMHELKKRISNKKVMDEQQTSEGLDIVVIIKSSWFGLDELLCLEKSTQVQHLPCGQAK